MHRSGFSVGQKVEFRFRDAFHGSVGWGPTTIVEIYGDMIRMETDAGRVSSVDSDGWYRIRLPPISAELESELDAFFEG